MTTPSQQLDKIIAQAQALKKVPAETLRSSCITDWLDEALDNLDTVRKNLPAAKQDAAERNLRTERAALQKEDRQQIKNIPLPWKVGADVENKGIFLGAGHLRDTDNKLLGVFNFFAAREDLREAFDRGGYRVFYSGFDDACTLLEKTRPIDGHGVKILQDEATLYQAMQTGSYNGEWFLPTAEIAKRHLSQIGKNLAEDKYLTCTPAGNKEHEISAFNPASGKIHTIDKHAYRNFDGHRMEWEVGGYAYARLVRAEPLKPA